MLNFVIQSVLQPKFVGDAVGLTTTMSFLSLIVWAYILGPLGAILAIPASLLFKALLIDVDPDARWLQLFFGDEPVFKVKDPDRPKRKLIGRKGSNGAAGSAVSTTGPGRAGHLTWPRDERVRLASGHDGQFGASSASGSPADFWSRFGGPRHGSSAAAPRDRHSPRRAMAATAVGDLWSRLLEMEFVDRSIALAAKAFVSFFPFLIVVTALTPDSVRDEVLIDVSGRFGISGNAYGTLQQAFTSADETRAATGVIGALVAVAFAISFTTACSASTCAPGAARPAAVRVTGAAASSGWPESSH